MPVKLLVDGTKYTKATYYDGGDLKGEWLVYIKLDGVRALRLASGDVVSRNSKPLHNLGNLEFNDAEIFSVNWNESVSLVRSESPRHITQDMVYNLDPPDPRLFLGTKEDPKESWLTKLMAQKLRQGHEGIIIRKGARWLKVVPELSADVRITGYKEGTNKNVGKLGSFLTNYGSVGSGLTDDLRMEFWLKRDDMIGQVIEVGYREMTTANKMRFPKFRRVRWDKDEESI